MGPDRISVEEVRRKQLDGEPVLLVGVCPRRSYECLHLAGAIPLDELERHCMGKGHEIVFYGEDASVDRTASEWFDRGYINAKLLDGGIAAWKRAGYPITLGT